MHRIRFIVLFGIVHTVHLKTIQPDYSSHLIATALSVETTYSVYRKAKTCICDTAAASVKGACTHGYLAENPESLRSEIGVVNGCNSHINIHGFL
jgi:hypothetical protein